MSIDLKIQNRCDHLINWEQVFIRNDLITVQTGYPVASARTVQVRVNNVVLARQDYQVIMQPVLLTVESETFITFNRKLKGFNPLIELKYATFVSRCPKCSGLRNIDDLSFLSSGDVSTSKKENLLVQNIEKFIVTKRDSNPFQGEIGTNLHLLLSTKITDRDMLEAQIVGEVRGAIEQFRKEQQTLISSGRKVEAGEILDRVISITLDDTDDPTTKAVTVVFTAKSGNTLEYSQFVQFSRERISVV